jgi:hypothetical protein
MQTATSGSTPGRPSSRQCQSATSSRSQERYSRGSLLRSPACAHNKVQQPPLGRQLPLYGDTWRGSPIPARLHLPPVRPRVGANDPAARTDHARPEGADKHRVTPAIGRQHRPMVTKLASHEKRPTMDASSRRRSPHRICCQDCNSISPRRQVLSQAATSVQNKHSSIHPD